MSPKHTVLLLASAASLGLAAPAIAMQDHHAEGHGEMHGGHHGEHHGSAHGDHHAGGHHSDGGHSGHHHGDAPHIEYDTRAGSYEGDWQGSWDGAEQWHGEWNGTYTDAEGRSVDAEYHGVWMGEARFISEDGQVLTRDSHGWREHGMHGGHHGRRGPQFAYSREERNQWLAECQYLMSYDPYEERRGNGGLVGGLLGAVFGGVVGNRVADGDRLLGTAIGAGVGAVAGAAIGSALDSDGDGEIGREELWAARYCEAYLQRYEAGAAWSYAQPAVMMVPVSYGRRGGHGHGHGHGSAQRCHTCATEIIEEWIEIEEPAPEPRPEPRPEPQPAPERESGKIVPLG